MNTLAEITGQACEHKFEYTKIAKAVAALNRVVGYVLEARRSLANTPYANADNLSTQQFQGQNLTTNLEFNYNLEDFVQQLPTFEGVQMTTSEDFHNVVSNERFEPVNYVQKIENQFMWNTMHNDRWNFDWGAFPT